MTLKPGARLAHYEIVGTLGAGGMGEVYAARDSRLGRRVAIKVLPASVAGDPERLMRFEREAQAIAALSHPNILSIFDFGRDGEVTYAVMELLDGESLRERLAAGPVGPRKAIDYAVQIARALASAHDTGIAHRDLKPENLFVTRDERIKVLDFGLAKPLDPIIASATLADTRATAAGSIIGTVGYMAPEQVRGQAIDHRADIFAFGVVLYEMVTGRRAFQRDTAADTLSAVLNAEPPELDATAERVPPALDRIIRRCLEKKLEARFQSAHDLAFALETLTQASSTSGVRPGDTVATPRRNGVPLAIGMATAALLAAGAVWIWGGGAPPADRWERFLQITDAAGEEGSPSLSPDGSTIAYATRAGGTWDIYVQRVGGRNLTAIAADPERNESGPAFSPDGSLIAFHEEDADGGIFVVGATGETPRRLTDIGFDPAWSPDGRRVAFTGEAIVNPASRYGDSSMWVVDVAGGAPQLVAGTGDAAQAAWSPDGGRLAYWSNTGGQRDIFTIPAAGGQRSAVTADIALDWSPTWTPDGRALVFASDRGGAMNLWRLDVDQSSGRTAGAPRPLTAGVQAALEQPSLSQDGRRIVFRSRISAINPVAVPFDPVTAAPGRPFVLNNSNSVLIPSAFSPDGRSVLYSSIGAQQEDLFASSPDGANLRRVLDDVARDRGPVWTPDGRSILFYSNRDMRWAIWRIGADGGNLQKVVGIDDDLTYPLLSPAGDRLITSGERGIYIAEIADATGSIRPLENTRDPAQRLLARAWSPDGTKLVIAFISRGGESTGLGLYDMAARTVTRINNETSFGAVWLSDSRRILYGTRAGEIVLLDTVSLQRRVVEAQLPLPPIYDENLALSPDNRLLIYPGRRFESDIWIVEQTAE